MTVAAERALCDEATASCLRSRRLDEAVEHLGGTDFPSTRRLGANLAANLAALREHRPEMLASVQQTPASSTSCTIAPLPDGEAGLFLRAADGCLQPLGLAAAAKGGDPLAQYRTALIHGSAKGLCGIGDGLILEFLAENPPKLYMDAEAAVYIIEPDPDLLLHALMLRDFSGEGGPIVASRFIWFIGPNWQGAAEATLLDEPLLPMPTCMIGQRQDHAAIAGTMKAIAAKRQQRHRENCRVANDHAASLRDEPLAALLGPSPPQRPRVLLFASRLTTVLQYAARDAAAAFTSLGFDVEFVTERAPHHVLCEEAVMHAMARFMPHAVFCIDHLRHEYRDMPPGGPHGLPFVCWIQDNLPNLTAPDAGRRITQRDFVIGSWLHRYVAGHGYPRGQCIDMPRLTRIRPAESSAEAAAIGTGRSPTADGRQPTALAYVSHHSDPPHERLERIAREYESAPTQRDLIVRAGQALIAHYERGEHINSLDAVKSLLARQASSIAGGPVDPQRLHGLAWTLFDRLNTLLYRQQALLWAAGIAEEQGLTLGIYGKGWEQREEFRRWARGPVAYGAALAELTRGTAINLQLEPYTPTSHQRLLDGLAAGGFFLMRRLGPAWTEQWSQWHDLFTELDEEIQSLEEAKRRLEAEQIERIEELSRWMAPRVGLASGEDVIAHFRRRQRTAMNPLPPRYLDVSFGDRAEMKRKVLHFLASPEERDEIARRQRAFVERIFGYEAGLRKAMNEIAARIGTAG